MAMDAEATSKFLHLKQQQLESCVGGLMSCDSLINELNDVKRRLHNLLDKTEHGVMVPIGEVPAGKPPLILMAGRIRHTNEILVSVGNGYFEKRSVPQSVGIIDRRVKKVQETKDRFLVEKGQHEEMIKTVGQFREENDNLVDLQEEQTEQEYEDWKKEHRQRVKSYRMTQKGVENEATISSLPEFEDPEPSLPSSLPSTLIQALNAIDQNQEKKEEEEASSPLSSGSIHPKLVNAQDEGRKNVLTQTLEKKEETKEGKNLDPENPVPSFKPAAAESSSSPFTGLIVERDVKQFMKKTRKPGGHQ